MLSEEVESVVMVSVSVGRTPLLGAARNQDATVREHRVPRTEHVRRRRANCFNQRAPREVEEP